MKTDIKFIKHRNVAFIISAIVIVIGLWFTFGPKLDLGPISPKGFNLGIEFKGGAITQVKVYSGIDIAKVRELAAQAGLGDDVQEIIISPNRKLANESSYQIKTILSVEERELLSDTEKSVTSTSLLEGKLNTFFKLINDFNGTTVYNIQGDEIARYKELNGIKSNDSTKFDELSEIISHSDALIVVNNVVKQGGSSVAPIYSKALSQQYFFLVLFVLLVILVYISIRFKPEFAVGAVAALFHDTLIILGVIAISGVQFDLTVVAAILTIIGYSINDTIVVFDRIRENTGIMKDAHPMRVFNISINQTLNRTVITSLTTLLVVVALFIFGGIKIRGFAFTMMVGIIVGTYSSIFVASPVVFLWIKNLGKDRQKIKKIEQKEEKLATVEGETSDEVSENATNEELVLSKQKMKKLSGKKKK